MKRLLKLFPLTLLLCLALALGLTACGEKKSYSVTAEYDANAGFVVLSDEGKNSDGKYQEGTSVTVTVTPKTGYEVASFTVNGTAETLSGNSYTFSVKEDTKIAVTFGATAYSVTLEKDFEEAMGTASLSSPASGTAYAKDELVTLTVTVNEGYVLDKVTVGGEEIELNEGKYSFKVKADTAVKVTIRAIGYYKVTVGEFDAAMGSVSVTPEAGESGTYREGTEITLSVSAKYGYKLLSVKVNGAEVTLENGAVSFKIEKDTSVEVSFEELETYKVTFGFDTEMCTLGYLGMNEEGKEGNISVLPNKATELYEGETVFTALPAGGYELVSVTVNGKEVSLTEKSFTLVIGKALQNADGEINVVVTCKWSHTELTEYAGEYTLGEGAWYTFTLTEETVFDFSADSYVATAAFYKTEGEIAQPKPEDTPVWTFNVKTNVNTDIHVFEAGTYLVHMLAESDGVYTTKLTVTKITALSTQLPESYLGNWKSTDGLYSMTVGEKYLVLKKEGQILAVTVTQGASQTYVVAFGGESYELTPYLGIAGTLSLMKSDAPFGVFLPDVQTTYSMPEAIYGIYSGVDGEGKAVDDLVISRGSITWGDKKLTLLTEVSLTADVPMALLSCKEGDTTAYYLVGFQQVAENQYNIMLADYDDLESMLQFTRKEELSQTAIEQKYWGTWKCTTANVDFTGYTLVITASSITVTDGEGKAVECTVGTYERYSLTYPKLTIGADDYYLTIVGRAPNESLRVTLISQPTVNFSFVKQTTASGTSTPAAQKAAAEPSPLSFDDELVGTWQNSELKVTVEKNSVTVADAEGNALSHSLRTETFRGRQYNAVELGGTSYLFLKADGT